MYGKPLTAVSSFKYLGQTLPSSDDDCLAVEQNLRMAWVKWVWLKKCLGREVADRRTVGRFYVAALQVVLLFGSETWVLTLRLD